MNFFYHRFIPNAAYVFSPLYPAEKPNSQTQKLTWTIEMSNAFNNARRALANATLLAHPPCDVPISLISDASDRGVGTVFEQFVDDR